MAENLTKAFRKYENYFDKIDSMALSESTLISEKSYSKDDYSLTRSFFFQISLPPSLLYCVIKNDLNMGRKTKGAVNHVDKLKLVNENSIKKNL